MSPVHGEIIEYSPTRPTTSYFACLPREADNQTYNPNPSPPIFWKRGSRKAGFCVSTSNRPTPAFPVTSGNATREQASWPRPHPSIARRRWARRVTLNC